MSATIRIVPGYADTLSRGEFLAAQEELRRRAAEMGIRLGRCPRIESWDSEGEITISLPIL